MHDYLPAHIGISDLGAFDVLSMYKWENHAILEDGQHRRENSSLMGQLSEIRSQYIIPIGENILTYSDFSATFYFTDK